MSHRVRKDEKKREMRGPTFVGCRPVVEDGKRERKERMYQKHKNRKFEEQLAPTNCPGRIYPDLPGRAVSPFIIPHVARIVKPLYENFIVDFSAQIVYNKGTKELRR